MLPLLFRQCAYHVVHLFHPLCDVGAIVSTLVQTLPILVCDAGSVGELASVGASSFILVDLVGVAGCFGCGDDGILVFLIAGHCCVRSSVVVNWRFDPARGHQMFASIFDPNDFLITVF